MNEVGPFEDDIRDRWARVRRQLRGLAADAMLVTRPENIYWLSGYGAAGIAAKTSLFHCLVITADRVHLIARSLESRAAGAQYAAPVLYDDHEDPFLLAGDLLREVASGEASPRVAFEQRYLSVDQHRRLADVLPEAEFVGTTALLEPEAGRLSEYEMSAMRAAARITDIGLEAGLNAVGEGIAPHTIIGQIHEAMYSAGQSDFERSFVAVWGGPDGGRMHDTLAVDPLVAGDCVTVEVMGTHRHYLACGQATLYVGNEPPPAFQSAHELVARMQTAALGAVRAGVTAGSVFDAANKVYREATGSDYFRRVGGSLGLTFFATDLVKGSDQVLLPGMPLLIQTLVTQPVMVARGTTVLVREDGLPDVLVAPPDRTRAGG